MDDLDSSIESLLDSIREVADGGRPYRDGAADKEQCRRSYYRSCWMFLQTEGPQHRQVLLDRAQAQGIHIGGRDKTQPDVQLHVSKDARFRSDGQGQWRITDDAGE